MKQDKLALLIRGGKVSIEEELTTDNFKAIVDALQANKLEGLYLECYSPSISHEQILILAETLAKNLSLKSLRILLPVQDIVTLSEALKQNQSLRTLELAISLRDAFVIPTSSELREIISNLSANTSLTHISGLPLKKYLTEFGDYVTRPAMDMFGSEIVSGIGKEVGQILKRNKIFAGLRTELKQEIAALAKAQHPQLGDRSPAKLLAAHLLQDIAWYSIPAAFDEAVERATEKAGSSCSVM
jgi:hypothetical protein